jgi:hypothetical protein
LASEETDDENWFQEKMSALQIEILFGRRSILQMQNKLFLAAFSSF